MKVSNFKEDRFSNSCPHFTIGYVECRFPRDCSRCEFADRIRRDNAAKNNSFLLFGSKDARRQTEKGGGADWWHLPIILTENAMHRLGIEKNLFYQIAIADGGPGVFLKNGVAAVDCHLFADPSKQFTISRHEAYGVPNEHAVKRYDDLFFMDLHKVISFAIANKQKGAWCL